MATTRIMELAASISKSVAEIQKALSEQKIPSPSFNENAPSMLPKELADAQNTVLEATAELRDLLQDPLSLLHEHCAHNNATCFNAIARFSIAAKVPLGGQVSFAELARRTPLSEQILTRLLRYAMTFHIFQEPELGMVAHTKASKALADSDLNDWLRAGTDEMWPAATKMVDASIKWPGSQEPNETGFCLANNTTDSIYQVMSNDPERAMRFGSAMKVFAKKPENDLAYLTDHYPWASLGQAQVLDIGGARGHVSLALAQKYPNLSFIVQDMPQIIAGAEADIPQQTKDRIVFQAHDLFASQEIQADVFLFRWVLHNWSDKYCIMALRAQLPGLQPGAKLIIQDTLLPEPGTASLLKERSLRANDLDMATSFNARERTVAEWKLLLTEADSRFVVQNVIEPRGSALGILEVVWSA